MTTQSRTLKSLAALAAGLLAAVSLPAQNLTFTTSAPTPTNSDVFSFIGSSNDSGNVNDGGSYADGAGNDGFTYVANNRSSMGQTFTTGPTAGKVTAIWIRHVGYTADTVATFWNFSAGSAETFRITDPSQVNTAGFAVDTETYTITGTEANWPGGASSSLTGTGRWLRFGLTNSVTLLPNTQYGYDITGIGGDYFETWGTNGNVYSGGTAYIGSTGGAVDNTLVALSGDRAFLIEFNGGTFSPPAPPANPSTINFQPYAPTPTTNDVYNLTGSTNDSGNVNNGGTFPDGAGNDGFTYVANGRPNMGQFFTTGSKSGGYHVAAIWIQNAGYTGNSSTTYYNYGADGNPTFTFRLTNPSQVGTTNFALDTEGVQVTGLETNNPSPAFGFSANGTGTWLRLGLSGAGTNILLQPNTQYGFDVMGSAADFFETLGTTNNVYGGGGAYMGTAASGVPDDTTNLLVGDRVFLVEMVGDNWKLQVTPPSITNQPANALVPQGANAIFTPVVNGSPFFHYQWYFNTNTLLTGQTNATLTVAGVNTNNGTIGAYSVVVTNNYGGITSQVAWLSVELPTVSSNITFSAASGGILDQSGVGTGLGVRLAGTGDGIPTDDPNLLLDTADGVLDLTSSIYDFNGQEAMATAEALGFNLSAIGFNGTQDFTVTGYITNAVVGQNYDQAGIFVGTANTNMVRGGIIYNSDFTADPGSYGVGNQNGADIGIATAAAPSGQMIVTIGRAAGVWSVNVNGLGVTPNAGLSFLNGSTDFTAGVFASNNGLDTPTAQVNQITASLYSPKLGVTNTGTQLKFVWNIVGTGLQSSTNLTNPNGWSAVPGASTSPYLITIPTSGNRYYRVGR